MCIRDSFQSDEYGTAAAFALPRDLDCLLYTSSNGRPDERVSVFLEESDLLERAGILRNEELAGVTRSYLRIRGHTPSAT